MAKKESKEPKEKKEKKEKKPKELGLFDILKTMFVQGTSGLSIYPKSLLEKNYFMINRILSIQFPMQGNAFQQGKNNPVEVIYCWTDFLNSKGYNRVPGFVFTKGVQRSKEVLDEKKKFPDATIREYANHYKYSIKDVYNALDLCSGMEQEIMRFQKMKEATTITKEAV